VLELFQKSASTRQASIEDVEIISAEIFGRERFAQHAHSLAKSHKISTQVPSVEPIIDRMADNSEALRRDYQAILRAMDANKNLTPAAQWLIDNYHLVEQHVHQTRADLPDGFYRQLPKLAEGHLAGHPRIFAVTWAYVAHTDSHFDPESLSHFIQSYQEVQPLTIGELWAVAISLRLILIENLRRISDRIHASHVARDAADDFADRIMLSDTAEVRLEDIFQHYGEPEVSTSFSVQLIQRCREANPLAEAALGWLKRRLAKCGKSYDTVVSDEHHRQGVANVTIRNIITSLRLIADVNWELWFDSVSFVDRRMRNHPDYVAMDFASRTLYRMAIEEIARGAHGDELAVTDEAMRRGGDLGYHLIGAGRRAFEQSLNFNPPLLRRWRDHIKDAGLAGYATLILFTAAVTLTVGFWPVFHSDMAVGWVIVLSLLALPVAVDFAIAISNFVITRLLEATPLPGFELRNGIPPHLRTIVAVPALLTSLDDIDDLLDRLEVHYLSNSDGELYFALVTDWVDAESEHIEGDEGLLQHAAAGIALLNARYDQVRFFLLHRARRWNALQGKWMGWERKRGKLHELNRLLRGARDTTFIDGAASVPGDVRYVITLDADTRLPRDAARRLVGKMAHPLNRPHFDAIRGRVVDGYGIMQPRVTPSLPVGLQGTEFQRIYSSPRGIDPYVFTVSDVYQDLFGEGSFAGKGIYDVDAFEAALKGKVTDNTMLSHDLFEGMFARSALVTDVEVVEEYPERYVVDALRQHRWTRGDWQLLPWIVSWRRSGLTAVGLWKMTDNLRRSLTPIIVMTSLTVTWAVASAYASMWWTAFVLVTMLLPLLIPTLVQIALREKSARPADTVAILVDDIGHDVALFLSNILFLAHRAGLMADAIIRTLYRLYVKRQNLLEWTTAAQAAAAYKSDLHRSYSFMTASLIAAVLTFTVLVSRGGFHSLLLTPFAVGWLLAPAAAWWMSKPKSASDATETTLKDHESLRRVARRTWRFFATFVNAQENMLPPDNLQESPTPVVARRTSPTNIGLYLLAVASAREFGWIGMRECLTRLEATLATLNRLEMYQGHLFNWYDTRDLRPLDPRYISTVDSGNLAGHLIALANLCDQWAAAPQDPRENLLGIEDVLNVIVEEYADIPNDRRATRPLRKVLEKQIQAFRKSLETASRSPERIAISYIDLTLQATQVKASLASLTGMLNGPPVTQLLLLADELLATIEGHFEDASVPLERDRPRLGAISRECRRMALAMDFKFLFDPQRQLLSIGFRVLEAMRDESCYDMLASEARLASFFAIAKGDVPTRHWFKLGRGVTAVRGGAVLISWSGSMFEYLMPSLVMRAPASGLLDQTTRLIVSRQIDYGHHNGVPWGISESAFNARDIEFTYQYSNFGVPGLGLKRGLSDNLVIAPYATGLAAMVNPRAAIANFELLAEVGARGAYGFREAVDYTIGRIREGEGKAVVQAYFAHHQGMTIVALLNAVKNGEMRKHFHNEPIVRATELLLQERAPRSVPIAYQWAEKSGNSSLGVAEEANAPRMITGLGTASPDTQLLSNGQYTAMLTAAGGSQSVWNGIALTRWREDGVCDTWGTFVYLKDMKSGRVWSAAHMPTATPAESYEVRFFEEKAEFRRHDAEFTTTVDHVVSPEDNSEARRVTVSNNGLLTRGVQLTTYAELALAPQAADIAHPAFSKLFVQTEYIPDIETLIATRRRRSPGEPEIWLGQFVMVNGQKVGASEFETDRSKFLGAGRDARSPQALDANSRLSGTSGYVLDPIFALRVQLRIPPGRQAVVTLWTMVAESREGLLDLVDRHRQETAYDRAMTLAWTQAQIQLRHMQIGTQAAHLYQTLGSHLIYANSALRPPSATITQQMGPQSSLWPHGISGDRPIALVRIDDVADIELVREMLEAFEYLKSKGLSFDLVILNDRMSSYVQDLQTTILEFVRKTGGQDTKGSVFALRSDMIAPETQRVLPATARVVIYGRRGGLAGQLARIRRIPASLAPAGNALHDTPHANVPLLPEAHPELEFFNGHGGFAEDGREYVVFPHPNSMTPCPWINVIANPHFGFHAAADGCGYTWFGNSRENQLTPWANDPISNPPGEAFYIRDPQSPNLISPTVLPVRSTAGKYEVRHGFGYTRYRRQVDGLTIDMTQCVPLVETVKLTEIRITNTGKFARKLTHTYFADVVMGHSRSANASFIVTSRDELGNALFAQNRWKNEGGEQVMFMDMSGLQTSWTGDRLEFLGKHGSMAAPSALARSGGLSNTVGAALDPCLAVQGVIEVGAGQSASITLMLGAASHADAARELVTRFRARAFEDVLNEVRAYWAGILGAVSVKTPDRSFDIVMNGWMLYQTLVCRIWGRSGLYQASGAYGFRDQLQDSMALLHAAPDLARTHILRAAARQFAEGDVQHWWLPETGRGIRTRISDDTVWLAYCVEHYLKTTGDGAILNEPIPFIEGQGLIPGEHDVFFLPSVSETEVSLYEHCARGLDIRLSTGTHGLPLIGGGDWNDGMNRVGEEGKGESVWLGWFMCKVLKDFERVALQQGDTARVERWGAYRKHLVESLDQNAWDGRWYRRAYFDDGSPLGSVDNAECRIDAIAQSWSVLSGAAATDKSVMALAMAYEELVKPSEGLALLFTPPFESSTRDPGYIKAYPPGVRENGGQYTHGAIWSIFAHAALGQASEAAQLFSMINPINHALTAQAVETYRVEPYVIAADVYSIAPHCGRGGWTWYTGSAGWFYRAGLEAILGITRQGDELIVCPCLPPSWAEAEVTLPSFAGRCIIRITRQPLSSGTLDAAVQQVGANQYVINLSRLQKDAVLTLSLSESP